jgi:hypothetical protein
MKRKIENKLVVVQIQRKKRKKTKKKPPKNDSLPCKISTKKVHQKANNQLFLFSLFLIKFIIEYIKNIRINIERI